MLSDTESILEPWVPNIILRLKMREVGCVHFAEDFIQLKANRISWIIEQENIQFQALYAASKAASTSL
jgi:hypothetical protein